MIIRRKNWLLLAAKDPFRGGRFVKLCYGRIPDASESDMPWRRAWMVWFVRWRIDIRRYSNAAQKG